MRVEGEGGGGRMVVMMMMRRRFAVSRREDEEVVVADLDVVASGTRSRGSPPFVFRTRSRRRRTV